MQVLTEEYNHRKPDPSDPDNIKKAIVDPRRILQLGGGKRRYAPEKEPDGYPSGSISIEAGASNRSP